MIKKYFAHLLIFTFFFLFLFNTANVSAQELSLSVSPPTFELTANPGDVQKNTIKLTNKATVPSKIEIDLRNFTAVGEVGSVELTDEDTSYALSKWITIEPSTVTLAPGETQVFEYTINVPANAEPGGHFGSVVFKTGGAKPQGSGASVSQEVASLILLKISGDVTEAATVETFEAARGFYEYGPVHFDLRVKNEGNVHVKPVGSISITNVFGKEVAVVEVEPKNVFPGSVRSIPAQWDKKYLFGKYVATAYLTYGADGEQLISTTTFTGLPYKIVGVAALALLFVFSTFFKSRKRLGKALKVLFGG